MTRKLGERTRLPVAEGCREQLNREFLVWLWRYPTTSRARVFAALKLAGSDVERMTVKTRRDVSALLASLG